MGSTFLPSRSAAVGLLPGPSTASHLPATETLIPMKPTTARFLPVSTALAVALAWGAASAAAQAQPKSQGAADLVVTNAAIYTVNAKQPWATAVAVKDGKFVAVGSDKQVQRWVGPKTQRVDLQGSMVIPGINDVHAHPVEGAYEALYHCAIAPQGDLKTVLSQVTACAERAEPGDWIVGGPWSSLLLAELEKPASLAALDAASKGFPVSLRDDTFHHRWVNSAVLQAAKIGPGSVAPPGGIYSMADGKPTGVLKEPPAWGPLEALIPAKPAQRLQKAAASAAQTLNSFGITAVQDAVVNHDVLKGWKLADQQGDGLSLRVVLSALLTKPAEAGSPQPPGPPPFTLQDAEGARSARVRPGYAKLFLDGVPMAYTALMLEPYLPHPGHSHDFRGVPMFTQPELIATLAALDKQGVPVKLHSVGDGAVRQALDAIEEVRRVNGPNGPRHQIAHITFVAPQDMARFAKLNVVADVSPMLWFPHPFIPLFEMIVGHERTVHSYPIKSLVKAGALVAGGSDWPAGQQTPDPWIGIEGLVTRSNPTGQVPGVLAPQERLSLSEALKIYTINSAKGMGLDTETGSIEVGKSADFAVLNQHLFKVPAQKLHQTKVQATYFQGRQVYAAPAAK